MDQVVQVIEGWRPQMDGLFERPNSVRVGQLRLENARRPERTPHL